MNRLESKSTRAPAPRILLADSNRWALSARLACSLSQGGFRVSAVCTMPGHPLLKTRAAEDTFHYSGLHPLQSLAAAIKAVEPDLVIPCCDRSVGHLHELHFLARQQGNGKLAELIERSLGSSSSFATVSSRYELLKVAREEGVRVPRSEHFEWSKLLDWDIAEDRPCVLKADGTWGGGGVAIVRSADQTQSSLKQLARMFRLRRALKRLLVNRDSHWLRSWLRRRRHDVIAQSYVHGRPANCAVACWQGRVLAGISVDVVLSDGPTGPASIVRVIENSEMMFAASRIAGRLQLSGLFGLDFMIEEGSNAAYLIEMNPRSTPLCHLRLGPGRDMVGELWAQLAAQPAPQTPTVTEKELIAYFPQACSGPSDLLEASFLDTPRDEPDLIQELLHPWPNRTLLYRLSNWLMRRPSSAASTAGSPAKGIELKTKDIYCP